MLPIRLSLPALALFVIGHSLQAQNQSTQAKKKMVQGVIMDNATSRSIPLVHVRANQQFVISDSEGKFSLMISASDSIEFSHVSYSVKVIKHSEALESTNLRVVMTPKINLLDEVVISTMTESEFKQKILETTPQLTLEEEAALENIRIINQGAKFASPLPMGSYEAYRDFLKGPQGVVIFSSNGSKGLVKAIKNILRPPTYKSSSFNRGSGKTCSPGFQKFSIVKMIHRRWIALPCVKK